MGNSGKQDSKSKFKVMTTKVESKNDLKNDLEDDIDALFRLPLADFTEARNALAAQLKKSGNGDKALYVKALTKPSISAWAVNQLYWNHRAAFDRLLASGERFHKAQTSGKVADMRAALDARRECLSQLSDIAASVLRNAGHNPAPDTIHRTSTTLEALSAYAQRADARHRPGRLTQDVDPPGFDLFGSSIPSAILTEPARVARLQKPSGTAASTKRKVDDDDSRQLEEKRKTKMAAARFSLQNAKRSLTEARAKAKGFEGSQRKAIADAKEAEKQRRDAEERLKKATAASEIAAERARGVADEVRAAASAVENAERNLEEASKELEKLFGESS